MRALRWTGNPFVDAGLAAIAAITEVNELKDLTPRHLEEAVKALERVLLSDQSLGLNVPKSFARTTMSQIFPNSELVNVSNWKGETPEEKAENVRRKFRQSLADLLKRAKHSLEESDGEEMCTICGRRCSSEAIVFVRQHTMPLFSGIVNFYPALAHGGLLCGLCALAVRFFPLSVMRTGVYNRLWFLHIQDLPVAKAVSRRYGWDHFHHLIARNEALDFFSSWETAGDSATVLSLFFELLHEMGDYLREIWKSPLPITAYVFSNDNRSPFIYPLPIPNEVLRFFAYLSVESPQAFRRFWSELLHVSPNLAQKEQRVRTKFVDSVAQNILNLEPILPLCLDNETPRLRGGWVAHRLYLQEVLQMPASKIDFLERLGLQIAQSEEAKKRVMELRQAHWNDMYSILLRYVREGWLKHDEFYTLLPPNDFNAAQEVRDVLLAVIYEWQNCQDRGEEFPSLKEVPSPPSPDEVLQHIQRIGSRLIDTLPNLNRWVGALQTARAPHEIRGIYLNAVRSGSLRFPDFLFLAPLGDASRIWLLRDYLLAFLFDKARKALLQEETPTGEENEVFFSQEKSRR